MSNLATAIVLTAYRERMREYEVWRYGNHLDDELVQEGIRLQLGLPHRTPPHNELVALLNEIAT